MKNRTQSSSYNRYSPVRSSYKRQPSPHTSPALPTETLVPSRIEMLAGRVWELPLLVLSNFNISGLFTHSVPRLRTVHSPPSNNDAWNPIASKDQWRSMSQLSNPIATGNFFFKCYILGMNTAWNSNSRNSRKVRKVFEIPRWSGLYSHARDQCMKLKNNIIKKLGHCIPHKET